VTEVPNVTFSLKVPFKRSTSPTLGDAFASARVANGRASEPSGVGVERAPAVT
jgi:hypothetical protein